LPGNKGLINDFFQRNRRVKAEKSYSTKRDLIKLHSLEPGEYVIIPSTYEPNITADFALRQNTVTVNLTIFSFYRLTYTRSYCPSIYKGRGVTV
uniref:Peptidase C2 calpain large subunit domain-containing protein n=1 Tax=Neolamprologus brichardi TaxID=32507 RepID=A0A3Q4GS54_NEOBR